MTLVSYTDMIVMVNMHGWAYTKCLRLELLLRNGPAWRFKIQDSKNLFLSHNDRKGSGLTNNIKNIHPVKTHRIALEHKQFNK